ncbi:hypothetical protein ACFE04_012757 [Oxalis oulophora]
MGFTMGLNMVLLIAMVATNILSLYHLSTTLQSNNTKPPSAQPLPDHLVKQLQTIRSTIAHLTRQQHPPPSPSTSTATPTSSDLLLYAHLSPIASSCHNHADLLNKYMDYTPFATCPFHSDSVAETLMLHGCHPLPRRRCFTKTPSKPTNSLPHDPFYASLPDNNIIWSKYTCNSLSCVVKNQPNNGFDMSKEVSAFTTFKTELDLTIQQLLQISQLGNSVLRLGIDIGAATGTFAAKMKLHNVTIVSTTMNLNSPYNEVMALRGLVPMHVPLQQRLPVFDGVMDLVRCGHAVNRWIPVPMMEFLLFDVDRVLRGGGYLWLDRFFAKKDALESVFVPVIGKLGYKKIKWATADKTNSKSGDVYLTALLQKPVSR